MYIYIYVYICVYMYICIFTRFDCQAGDLGVGPHAKDFISRPGILQIPLCAQLNEYGTDRRAAAIDHSLNSATGG